MFEELLKEINILLKEKNERIESLEWYKNYLDDEVKRLRERIEELEGENNGK